jgi:hypothetical protein
MAYQIYKKMYYLKLEHALKDIESLCQAFEK